MSTRTKRIPNLNKTSSLLARSVVAAFSLSLLLNLFPSQLLAQDSKKPDKVLAITMIVSHPSLEQAKKGILDELDKGGYKAGSNLKIIDANAQGNIATATQIAKKFVSQNPDVIAAISTPSAQTVLSAAKQSKVPVVFSSVSDPISAGLVKDYTSSNSVITGARDSAPLDQEMELIATLLPNLKTLGLLYNAGEANSVNTIKELKKLLSSSVEIKEVIASNSAEAISGLKSLIGKVDAVYIPSDNMVFAVLPKISQLALEKKLPVITSDPDSVKVGVFACAGYTQYAVGQAAGKLVLRLFEDEPISKLRVVKPEHAEIFVNMKVAAKLQIKIPDVIAGIKVTKLN